MLISIHDKTLQRVAFIDNEKPGTLHFFDDVWHRYLTEATSTFDFSVPKTGNAALQYLTEKNYVSFQYEGQDYLFNIMRTEETEDDLACYCENLNLELLNEQAAPFKANGPGKFVDYFNNETLIGGKFYSDLVIGFNEVAEYSRTLEWEGTDSKLSRLLSLVNKFDAECEFITELNRDGTLKRIVLNIYKKHDDTHQGVGTRRQDVTLYYGKEIEAIRRTIDKTNLYSAIYPQGKDGLSITTVEKTEYDADGRVLYYTHSGQPYLYAPQTAEEYPAQISGKNDRWILYRWNYETDNINTLYGQALAKLKEISVPAITYEVDGSRTLEIGDTVKIHDDKFTPTLLLEARVSEQEVSFSDPTKNKNVFSNFKALENKLSTDITGRLDQLIQEALPYTAEILSDNGTVFRNGEGETTLTARVLKGNADVTQSVNLTWQRADAPQTAATTPSVTIQATEVLEKAVYKLAVKNAGGNTLATAEVTLTHILDGANGEQGAPGVSATAIQPQYYLSTSDTVQTGGTWGDTCPEWEAGKFIWTRSKCSWSNNTTTFTTPVLSQGLNQANENANNANNKADNANQSADNAKALADAAKDAAKVAEAAAEAADILARAAQTNAEAAKTAADGKNTVFYAASMPPVTGRAVNDIWFDTANGNRMYYWDGLNWTPKPFGTNAIAEMSITNVLLANASIDNAKIANLDAGKITTGILDAERIGAGSLTVGKLTDAALAEIQKPAADAQAAANTAAALAEAARTAANTAKSTADTAKINAATAQSTADTAKTNAATAQSAADAAKATLAAWCYNNNLTYIDGANIYTGTITAAQIAAQTITADKFFGMALQSKNYIPNVAGTKIDLANGTIDTKNFKVDSAGNVAMTGTLTMQGAQTLKICNNSAVEIASLKYESINWNGKTFDSAKLYGKTNVDLAVGSTSNNVECQVRMMAGAYAPIACGQRSNGQTWVSLTGSGGVIGIDPLNSPAAYATGCTKEVDFTPASGFTKLSGYMNKIVYNAMGKFCFLAFTLSGNITAGPWVTVLTLPAGYRPSLTLTYSGNNGNRGLSQIRINPNGTVQAWGQSNLPDISYTAFYYVA